MALLLLREVSEGGVVSDILGAQMNADVVPLTDEWVKFLVRDMDEGTLATFRKQADADQVSVAEYMRQILCSHFELDCVPSRASARPDSGSTTRLLRLQPELFAAIRERARVEDCSMQQIVKAALGA